MSAWSRIESLAPLTFSMTDNPPISRNASRVSGMRFSASDGAPPKVDVDARNWNEAYQSMHKSGIITRSNTTWISPSGVEAAAASAIKYDKDKKIASLNGYSIDKTLGKGAFGEVFLAKREGELFAIKALRSKTLKKTRMPGQKAKSTLDNVKSEIATLKKIMHPNCVGMLDVIHDKISNGVPLAPVDARWVKIFTCVAGRS